MRYLKILGILIVLICLLCSCVEGESNIEIKVADSNITLIDLVTVTYSKDELIDITQFNGNMYELNTKFPIECIRNSNNNYRVSYLGDHTVAIITFDNLGNKIAGTVYSMQLSKSDFSSLTNGCSLNDVQKIDPFGEYLFLYTGRNDVPRCSTHYTTDGYLISIMYDDNNIINDIKYELI